MRILVTGGAGFIGSNLIEKLLSDERVSFVRVLDNLSTGFIKNIEPFLTNSKFEFVEGDIRNLETCMSACREIDLISHQAALGSVPRSIQDPITTNDVNIGGTLNIFLAAKETNVKRVVFAASSSTYGDSKELPKIEDKIGKPLSPYAVTKFVNEIYADVFNRTYGLKYIGLRYFNIFGPNQSPDGAYAAVIPLFIKNILSNKPSTINGDGNIKRDFTYVANAVQANVLALFAENAEAINQIYNVACGSTTTLTELYNYLKEISHSALEANYGPERKGDIPLSLADISKAKKLLGYRVEMEIKEGLKKTFEWYRGRQE